MKKFFSGVETHTVISIENELAVNFAQHGMKELAVEKLTMQNDALHKIKYENWPLEKKINVVNKVKSHLKTHEDMLQERLTQSKNTIDAVARASFFINKKYQHFKREALNVKSWLIPWQLRIKHVESQFGSAVVSYFLFLRWLCWINFVIFLTLTTFIIVPEMLVDNSNYTGDRKILIADEVNDSKQLSSWWEFEGVLKHSPFFYGWYSNSNLTNRSYRLPLAYFLANLAVYIYSFIAILLKY